MIRYFFKILMILFLLVSCSSLTVREEYLFDTIKWHEKKYAKTRGLHLAGTGGSIPEQIQTFTMYYEAEMQIGIDEARRLIIPMVEDFIQHVNQNTEIAPYMQDFPINSKNVHLMISFVGRGGEGPRPPYLSMVSVPRDIVMYRTWNGIRLITVHKEKYEDALRIIREEQGLCE